MRSNFCNRFEFFGSVISLQIFVWSRSVRKLYGSIFLKSVQTKSRQISVKPLDQTKISGQEPIAFNLQALSNRVCEYGPLSLVKSTILILASGFIGVNLSGFLVDKFKRLKLVALFCVTMCKYLYQTIVFDKNVFLSLIFLAVISYGIVIYVITLKKVWIVMVVVPGTDQTVRFRR